MSFGWTMMMRLGAWQEFRKFALNQRKNVEARIARINHDLARIGSIRVSYGVRDPNDPYSTLTEERVGLYVTEQSSLGKLLRAYTARGGNPFDISMFLIPDSYDFVEDAEGDLRYKETQPFGGVLSPESGDAISDSLTIGLLPIWADPARKLGSKASVWDDPSTNEVGKRVIASKSWLTQEIKELRNDLEARIIKLCDLREQLLKERTEVLISCVGGLGGEEFDPDRFLADNHLANIVTFFDKAFYLLGEDGKPDFSRLRRYVEGKPKTLLDDAPTGEEKYHTL